MTNHAERFGGANMGQPTLVKPGAKIKLADYDPGYCAGLSKKDPEVVVRS